MVARVPDAMLRKIDPAHTVLINYLKIVNADVETGVLLHPIVGPSKTKKGSKKSTAESPLKLSPTKATKVVKPKKQDQSEPPPVVAKKPEVSQPETTVLPSKSGVLKKLKKMDHKPSPSSEKSRSFSPMYKVKPQINKKMSNFSRSPSPSSPAPKKRRTEEMEKHFSKK